MLHVPQQCGMTNRKFRWRMLLPVLEWRRRIVLVARHTETKASALHFLHVELERHNDLKVLESCLKVSGCFL
jgi:hypothetical protein